MTKEARNEPRASNVRTRLGLEVTVVYSLFIIAMYTFNEQTLGELTLNEFGDYFAGVFGPIAILWLVLGYLQQGDELRQQAKELNDSVAEQRALVLATRDQISAEKQARQDAFEEARRVVRPIFEIRIYNESADGVYGWYSIKIRSREMSCRLETVELRCFAQTNTRSAQLKQIDELNWEARIQNQGADPGYVTLHYINARYEREVQGYVVGGLGNEPFWEAAYLPHAVKHVPPERDFA